MPGYVLVSPIEEETTSAGGVYLPEESKDKPSKGKVVACGADKKGVIGEQRFLDIEESPVKTGDVVIYKKWTNQEVQHEGKEYLLVKFDEVLAVIE